MLPQRSGQTSGTRGVDVSAGSFPGGPSSRLRAERFWAHPCCVVNRCCAASPRRQPPNVVLILCDDLGFGDVHSYGSSIATPNIDGMAQEGVRFQQFYSASNVCSPSRAGVLTGQYPTRVGVPDVLAPTSTTGLSLSAKTIAEVLKPLGYNTMCVGKWHLGTEPQFLPTSRGFDYYYGIPYSNDQSPSILMQNTTVIESPVVLNTLTQRYTQQATNFIQLRQRFALSFSIWRTPFPTSRWPHPAPFWDSPVWDCMAM